MSDVAAIVVALIACVLALVAIPIALDARHVAASRLNEREERQWRKDMGVRRPAKPHDL